MKNNTSLLIFTLAATAATSGIALAEEKPVEQPAADITVKEPPKSAAEIAEQAPAAI